MKKKLSRDEVRDIRVALMKDNARIERDRVFGDQKTAMNAKRAEHLRPSNLAARYKVTVGQIYYAAKNII
jgi:hypothetical protein|tara:strand:- start:252 stop:461 length:210 start_codon:yes stop_codon:yes gene_type:complete